MSFSVAFEKRNFTEAYIDRHWRTIEVDRFSRSAVGGPKSAYLTAYGNDQQMFEFVEMLRCPVRIMDTTRGKEVWQGYINKVDIQTTGGLTYSVSLDAMANKIRVAYTYSNMRATTDWSSDLDSQAEYGIKELQLSAYEKTAAQVDQLRVVELALRKFPPRLPLQFGDARTEASCKIECFGWFETLGWSYFSVHNGVIIYEDGIATYSSIYGREIGEDDRPICAQSFTNTSGADFPATSIGMCALKVGSPTDTLNVSLYSHNATFNIPDTLITTTTGKAGASLDGWIAWYNFPMTTPTTLTNNTKYWLYCSRSGAVSASNYFFMCGESYGGYQDGELKVRKTTGVWTSKENDLYFEILGPEDNTSVIDKLMTACGQFYTGADIVNTSGVDAVASSDGDATGLYQLVEMLKIGTTNGRRLLADTTPQRKLRIYEQPAIGASDYSIDGSGILTDNNGAQVSYRDCPVGFWAKLKDVVPTTADISRIQSSSHMFIETAEYSVKSNKYRIIETGESGLFDFLKVREG